MKAIQQLIEVLERIRKGNTPHEVGYETLRFTHEEIGEELVLPYIIAFVEAPILCHSANYTILMGTTTP